MKAIIITGSVRNTGLAIARRFAAGTGITILRPDLVAVRDYAGIRALAKTHLEACRQ